MASSINRAQFLSGDFHSNGGPIRPPWSMSEEAFLEKCTTCGDCIKACPEGIIKGGRGNYPVVDFSNGYCDFCDECLESCKPKALIRSSEDVPPWPLKAKILESCLSINATTCRSCAEACDERAIRFELKTGGIATPLLNLEECTGCGGCYSVCPVRAVEIFPIKNEHANAA